MIEPTHARYLGAKLTLCGRKVFGRNGCAALQMHPELRSVFDVVHPPHARVTCPRCRQTQTFEAHVVDHTMQVMGMDL